MVSIIVPVYKSRDTLTRCVESLQNQTAADLEILLVDDGSPDGSGELCRELAGHDARIRVIHKENEGCVLRPERRDSGSEGRVPDFHGQR